MQLKIIDSDVLDVIKARWTSQLDALPMVNPARCLGAISRAHEVASDDTSDQYAYAYMGTGGEYEGIVLLSHACPRSQSPWLKMLELTLAPSFANPDNPPPLSDLFNIGGVVLAEVFGLSSDKHQSSSVKIYGDSIMEARIWRQIAEEAEPDDVELPFTVSSHGSWLVLTRR